MKYLLIIIFTSVIVFSCNNNKNERNNIVKEWIGKEISLKDTLLVFSQVDSSLIPLSEIHLKQYKFIVYIDASCFTCAKDLIEWGDIVKEFNAQKIDFLFYIYTDNFKVLKPYLKRWHFTLPFVLDTDKTFFYSNNISNEKLFQAMLIDKNNKVVIIGNPVYSKDIISLYKKLIN